MFYLIDRSQVYDVLISDSRLITHPWTQESFDHDLETVAQLGLMRGGHFRSGVFLHGLRYDTFICEDH